MQKPASSQLRIPAFFLPNWLPATLSFLLPFFYCLYFGRIGFNPLDSSIVFDGGYRILQGEHYLADFFAPAGYVPSLVQSLFFFILGVNWFALCLHAALFNGLFCWLGFKFLRLYKAPPLLALGYALLSGMVFYAPFGTPFPDQHSFFFSFLGIFLLVSGSRKSVRRGRLTWFATGPVFLLAFLSKPIPAGYAMVLAVLLLPVVLKRNNWK